MCLSVCLSILVLYVSDGLCDITDCKTCLFYVSGLFVLFCFRIVCVYVFKYMRVCVRVQLLSRACYRWIVNDITDCNSCLFSVSVCVVLFYSCMCKVVSVCVRLCVYMITL